MHHQGDNNKPYNSMQKQSPRYLAAGSQRNLFMANCTDDEDQNNHSMYSQATGKTNKSQNHEMQQKTSKTNLR